TRDGDVNELPPRPACARTSTSHVLPPLAIEMSLWRGSSNLGPPPQGIRARAPWSLPLSDRRALFVAVPPWGRDQAGRRESRDAPEDLAEEAPCQAAFGQLQETRRPP